MTKNFDNYSGEAIWDEDGLEDNRFVETVMNGYGRSSTNAKPLYDDYYLAVGENARARIEIGNNSDYYSCTNMSICTIESWGNTEIVANFNRGSLSNGMAWVFVSNSDGTISEGYQITLE